MKPWWQTLADVIASELVKRWVAELRQQIQPLRNDPKVTDRNGNLADEWPKPDHSNDVDT